MSLIFETEGTLLKAKISGELDHHIAGSLREKIDLKLATGVYNNLILDFSELGFMDSSGIALIMGRVKYLEPVNGRVRIITENEQIIRILKMSGIDKYAEISGGI